MGFPIDSRTPAAKPAPQQIRRATSAPQVAQHSSPRDSYTSGGDRADYEAQQLEEQRIKLFVGKNRARGQDVGMRRDGNGTLRAQWNTETPGTKAEPYFASKQHQKDAVEFLKGEGDAAVEWAKGQVQNSPAAMQVRFLQDPVGQIKNGVQSFQSTVEACIRPKETVAEIGKNLHQQYVQPFKDGDMRGAGRATGKIIIKGAETYAVSRAVTGIRPGGGGVRTSSTGSGNTGGSRISGNSGSGGTTGSASSRSSAVNKANNSSQTGSAQKTAPAIPKVTYTLDHGTKIPDAASITNLMGTATKKIGDFKDLKGATIAQLIARVPKNAIRLPWAKSPNGAEEGFKFQWTDSSGAKWDLRIHGPDPSAPPGSNATDGWIYRVIKDKKYLTPEGRTVHPNAHKPASPNYAPDMCKEAHIPVKGNPVLP